MRSRFFGFRILLLLATNLAVVLLLSVLLRLFGVDDYLAARGGALNYKALLIFAAAFGFGGAFISLLLSKWLAKMGTRARVIKEARTEEESWLVETVRRLAMQAGVGMPEVAIYPSPDLNAFATGARRNKALVAVSEGILRTMPRHELQAVLAHEMAHVANGDMITLTLVQGVLNTFVIFLSRIVAFVVDNFLAGGQDERRRTGIGYFITYMVMEMILGVLASIVVAWYSRRREFRADAGSAELVGPGSMIAALRTLQRIHQPSVLPESMKAFGIRGGGMMRLFASHPPLEARIAALQGVGLQPNAR